MQSNSILYLPLNIVKVAVAEFVFIAVTSFVVLTLNFIGVIETAGFRLAFMVFILIAVIPLYVERKYILHRIFS